MGMGVIDTIKPISDFPVADARDIDVKGERLDEVLKKIEEDIQTVVCEHDLVYIDALTNLLPTELSTTNAVAYCKKCGITMVTPKLNGGSCSHEYEAVVTPPTCTEQGYTTYTCSLCGESYVDDYVQANGHNYGEWTITLEPTCTETGTRRRDCSRCDAYETEVVSALGHIYAITKVGATCTEQGYDLHTCTECGDTYKDNYIEALGHSYGEWIVTLQPACTETGTRRADCTRCDHYKTETVEALGHIYSTVKVGATCVEQGYDLHTCSRCGHSYKDNYTDATGEHTYGEGVTITEAGCATEGLKRKTCSVCGATIDEVIPATGNHTYGEWVTTSKPTCTADGVQTRTCDCGITQSQKIPSLGHVWKAATCTAPKTCSVCGATEGEALGHDYKVTKNVGQNCIKDGYILYTCSRCGDTYTKVIPADGVHSYSATVVAPTCTEQGYTEYICDDCGESYKDNYTDALGHSWSAWEDVHPASCEASGMRERKCTVCGEVETEIIEALGHDYDSVVTPPTCGDGGYTLHTCSSCGHSYYDNYTDPTGLHNWGDWTIDLEPTCTSEGSKTCTCKDCGKFESQTIPKTEHILGDWIIDKQPTTEEEGSKHQECIVCGINFGSFPIPKLEDTNTYLVTESGEYLTDEQGNLLIL